MEHNYMNEPKPTNRIIEMILGITGSIFGIIGGLIALILTNYDKSYGSELVGLMTIVATSSIILSAITLTLSCLINKRRLNWYYTYCCCNNSYIFIRFLVIYQVF